MRRSSWITQGTDTLRRQAVSPEADRGWLQPPEAGRVKADTPHPCPLPWNLQREHRPANALILDIWAP